MTTRPARRRALRAAAILLLLAAFALLASGCFGDKDKPERPDASLPEGGQGGEGQGGEGQGGEGQGGEGQGGGESPIAPELASSQSALEQQPTVAMKMTMSASGSGETFDAVINGAFDYKKKTGDISYHLDVGGETMVMSMRMFKDVYYVTLPEEMQTIPKLKKKEWLEIPVDELDGEEAAAYTQTIEAADPRKALTALYAAGAVEKIGREKIDGVPTTHYRAVVDLAKELETEGMTKEQEELLEASRDELEALGVLTYPLDIWIDDDDLPRKLAYEIAMSSDTQESKVKFVITFPDWGLEVKVKRPKDDTVVTLAELEKIMGTTTSR